MHTLPNMDTKMATSGIGSARTTPPVWISVGMMGKYEAIFLSTEKESHPCAECGKGILWHDAACWVIGEVNEYQDVSPGAKEGENYWYGWDQAYCATCGKNKANSLKYSGIPEEVIVLKEALTQH